MKKQLRILLSFIAGFLAILLYVQSAIENDPNIPRDSDKGAFTPTPAVYDSSSLLVTKIIDGDTIQLDNGKKVRYIGIDTPEIDDPRSPVECFGKEASAENKRLVLGKVVRLEKDVSETDSFGRFLRYVYVDNIMINELMVRNGFALVVTYPPDVKYQDHLLKAEAEARENNRGLWQKC